MANLPLPAHDLAQTRHDNALALFEEFVRATARHADAATLRGLERRFAERVLIQPSYWSQIKGRSRQIGERLARQFEQACHKPPGWLDRPHGPAASGDAVDGAPTVSRPGDGGALVPRDADERFMLDLVLTYYRRDPLRARTRLLGLLGEVLVPPDQAASTTAAPGVPPASVAAARAGVPPPEDPHALWQRTQGGVAPLRKRPR